MVPATRVLAPDIDLRALATGLAITVLAGAGTLFLLWVGGDAAIKAVLTSTMKPNTAFSLALLAGSGLLAIRGRTAPSRWLAAVAALIGIATLAEYALDVDLRLDELFARDAPGREGSYAGRMAPNAAQAIATFAVALSIFPGVGRARRLAAWLNFVVAIESVLALLGYLHGTTSLYQVPSSLRISQYTALALLLLGVAAFAAWPQGTAMHLFVRRTAGGLLARRILPPLLAIPVLLGFLRNAGENAGLYDGALGTALMTAGILLLVGVLVWFNARSIDRLDEAQRRISAENERLAEEARAAVALRDEFIMLAGHELRTPLTALQLRIHLEERRAEPRRGEEVKRWKHLIERLSRLVEAMLDTTRIGQQEMRLQLGPLDLHDAVGTAVDRVSPVFVAAQCPVNVRSEPGFGIRGDAVRIEQAIENLLLNAAKYGAGQDIDVSLTREGPTALLSVRDRGIGVAASDQQRIFERFGRAVPASHFGGLGLGLYLVRRVMEAHGGDVSVQSVPGEGATFVLRFPLATPPEERPEPAPGKIASPDPAVTPDAPRSR